MRLKIYLITVFSIFNILANAQNIYTNDHYGLSFTTPKNWSVINHKQRIADGHGSHGQALVTYYKNANNVDEKINPTIEVSIVKNNFKTIEKFKRKTTRRYYHTNLANYSIKKKPELVTINGNLGSFETSTYTFINNKDEDLYVKRRRYAFYSKESIFYVSFIDERYNEENLSIFNDFINSIKFGN